VETTQHIKISAVILVVASLSASLLLASFGSMPAQAAFSGTNGQIVFTSYPWGNSGYWDIYAMSSDGTDRKKLTNDPAWDGDPVFSPDGTKIAFATNRNGNYEIYVMNADGTAEKRLTNNPDEDRQPAFSPDGKRIAFTRVVENSYYTYNSEVYIMNLDGTGEKRLTNSLGGDDFPTFSPDGTEIAFRSCRNGNSEIYAIDSNGDNPVNLTKSSAWDGQPDFSADGTKIAFASQPGGAAGRCTFSDFTSSDIYVMNPDGTEQKRLTTDPGQDSQPNFSADGTKIAFWHEGANDPHKDEVYAMHADGSGQTNLSQSVLWNEQEPDWGPLADVLPPETTIDSGPSATVNSASATFEFSSNETGSTFECSLDGGTFQSCTSPKSYTGLSEGSHTFQVKATDAAGNTDATPASQTWTVDTTKPASPTVDLAAASDSGSSSTDNLTNEATPSFTGAAEAGSAVELFVDGTSLGTATASGTGEWNLAVADGSALLDGEHHIAAKATDAAGNVSEISGGLLVTVDTAAPKVEQVVPSERATKVASSTNVVATFSEKMDPATLAQLTFKLFKLNLDGTTTQITDVTVTPSSDGLSATLDPYGASAILLESNTRYRAVASIKMKDLAGNALDQDPYVSGNQRETWSFKTS
jgi:Tol biopolymer transport system component